MACAHRFCWIYAWPPPASCWISVCGTNLRVITRIFNGVQFNKEYRPTTLHSDFNYGCKIINWRCNAYFCTLKNVRKYTKRMDPFVAVTESNNSKQQNMSVPEDVHEIQRNPGKTGALAGIRFMNFEWVRRARSVVCIHWRANQWWWKWSCLRCCATPRSP